MGSLRYWIAASNGIEKENERRREAVRKKAGAKR